MGFVHLLTPFDSNSQPTPLQPSPLATSSLPSQSVLTPKCKVDASVIFSENPTLFFMAFITVFNIFICMILKKYLFICCTGSSLPNVES